MNKSPCKRKRWLLSEKDKHIYIDSRLNDIEYPEPLGKAWILITKGRSMSGVCQKQDFQELLTTSYVRESEDSVKYSIGLSCLDL